MAKARKVVSKKQRHKTAPKSGHKVSKPVHRQKRPLIDTVIRKSLTAQKRPTVSQLQASQSFCVPFHSSESILLVGEGDFSFSHSLVDHYGCHNLICTTLESRSTLAEKYPQSSEYVKYLEDTGAKMVYSIDATALGHPNKGGGNHFRKLGPFDKIVFNFPHTGGLTKDVNRQVRANQELLVGFFKSALGMLGEGGRIVVTIFEGEPYELWGIRNLARHAGLGVVRSTRFEWEKFPSYRHARTLGNVKGGGGWKGEDRAARMYIFGRPGEEEKTRPIDNVGSDDAGDEVDEETGSDQDP